MTIEERLNEFRGTEEKNLERIEKIMLSVGEIPPLIKPKRSGKVLMWAASLILCLSFLMPINGQSFAGTIIEWFKETIIETEMGFMAASDEHIAGVLPEYEEHVYEDLTQALSAMGDHGFEVPVLPEDMIFHSAIAYVFDQGDDVSVLYRLQFAPEGGDIGGESLNPQVILQVNVNDYRVDLVDYNGSEGEVEIKFGTKVVAEGLQSTSVDFMESEALFTKYNNLYSLAAQPITIPVEAGLYRQISCTVSYANMGTPELWTEGLTLLEDVYRQYLK